MASAGSVENEAALMFTIENEITDLYNHCKNIGLSDEEIKKLARPLLLPFDVNVLKTRWKKVVQVFLVCFVLGVIGRQAYFQDLVYVYARIGAIKLLPYYDWQPFYHSACAIENPLYENKRNEVKVKDCEICLDLLNLDVLENVSPSDVLERYLEYDTPVIITDAMHKWQITGPNALETITSGFLENSAITEDTICMFETNLRVSNVISLITKVLYSSWPLKWYSHWENCDSISQKYLRKFYQRPYFLPEGLEMTRSNWVFVSSHYKGQHFKLVDTEDGTNVIWMGQALGENRIQLQPCDVCRTACKEVNFTLVEGQIVVVPLRMWSLKYGPGTNSTNVAIAATGYFNP